MIFRKASPPSKMADALKNLFGESTRVLVDDGEFNEVQGEFHHYDYSQRVTNNGCYNIIGNTIHNVSNTCPTDFCMFPRLSSGFRIGLLITRF